MKHSLIAIAALALLSATANADTIVFQGTGRGIGGFSATYDNGSAADRHTYGNFAGELRLSGIDAYPGQTVAGYCLDFFDYLAGTQIMTERPIGQYPGGDGDAPPHAVAGSGPKVGYLMEQFYALAVADSTGITAGALQLAIWEVALENRRDANGGFLGYGLGSGWFTASSSQAGAAAAVVLANGWLSGISDESVGDAIWLDVVDRHPQQPGGQDFAVPVPEPASLLLVGTGLLGLSRLARRRR